MNVGYRFEKREGWKRPFIVLFKQEEPTPSPLVQFFDENGGWYEIDFIHMIDSYLKTYTPVETIKSVLKGEMVFIV